MVSLRCREGKLWGSCGLGELRYVTVALCDGFGSIVAVRGSCCVGELWCGEVAMWVSLCVGGSWCGRVAV